MYIYECGGFVLSDYLLKVFRYWNSFPVDISFKSVYGVEFSCSNRHVIPVSNDRRQKRIIK